MQMPLGFLFIIGGVLLIMYGANKIATDDWLIWGIACAIVLAIGIGLLGSALVHKIKSDLIRKDRRKVRPGSEVIDE
jgi:hypothetical protein